MVFEQGFDFGKEQARAGDTGGAGTLETDLADRAIDGDDAYPTGLEIIKGCEDFVAQLLDAQDVFW